MHRVFTRLPRGGFSFEAASGQPLITLSANAKRLLDLCLWFFLNENK